MKLKTDKYYLIPLFAAIPVAALSIFMIVSALRSDGISYSPSFVAYGGTFRYNDIHVLGISLYMFLMLIGLGVAVVVSIFRRRQYGFGIGGSALVTVLLFLQSYLGAKLLFGVENAISNHSLRPFSISGQSLFGVLYISVLVIPLLALLFKKKPADLFDFFTSTFLILLIFIRLGCFTSGCCGARELSVNGSPLRLPVQLFEILFDLAILALCLWLDRPRQDGRSRGRGIFPVLLVTYCITRFFLEFIRSSTLFFFGLSISQIHCLIFFTVGAVWLCYLWEQDAVSLRRAKRKATHRK